MSNSFASYDDAALEALIRAAGDHVQVSDGLRPQVIEAVRDAKGLRRDRARLTKGTLLCAAALLLLATVPGWSPNYDLREPSTMDEVFSSVGGEATIRGNDLGWRLVEIFTDVRERQAKSLGSGTAE